MIRERAMAVQDPTVSEAEIAFKEAELIDGGSAVSWGAIFAGALSAAALSFVLLAIGAAFGLSVVTPWDFTGGGAAETAAAVGIGTAIFLVVVHAIASGIGGYLAGRLRPKPVGVRGDETYFRDTAHGLVVWAVSALTVLLMIGFLTFTAARGGVALGAAGLSAAGQAAGGAVSSAVSSAAPALMEQVRGADPIRYFVDTLFRPAGPETAAQGAPAEGGGGAAQAPAGQAQPGAQPGGPTTPPQPTGRTGGPAMPMPGQGAQMPVNREEVGRIMSMALDGELSPEDRTYVAQLVSQETGVPQAQAEQRVNEVVDRARTARTEAAQTARQAADAARQAGMYTALWGAIAMLAGAFCAALAAAWGGRTRDV
jgi:hypothetical protein